MPLVPPPQKKKKQWLFNTLKPWKLFGPSQDASIGKPNSFGCLLIHLNIITHRHQSSTMF